MEKGNNYIKLSNGVNIPLIGYGTWQTPDGETAVRAVAEAIAAGYRLIDAAAIYGNEESVGEGIRKGLSFVGLRREDIFISSKVWNTERGYEKTKAAFHKTCEDLGVDYLDLYLIHWPAGKDEYENPDEVNLETWRALTELYKEGKIKSIGVSNFMPCHLAPLMKTEVRPMVNQIEYHPGKTQDEAVEYCKNNNIIVEAWSPLGMGKTLQDESLKRIANKYDKSVAQICIKWIMQNGIVPLPKSVTPSRIKENIDVFDFVLNEEDSEKIFEMRP